MSTAAERKLAGQIAGNAGWANTPDRAARVASTLAIRVAQFEAQIDPAGELDPADRRRRAESLLKAHYSRMALQSAKNRRLAKEAAALAAAADTELAALGQ